MSRTTVTHTLRVILCKGLFFFFSEKKDKNKILVNTVRPNSSPPYFLSSPLLPHVCKKDYCCLFVAPSEKRVVTPTPLPTPANKCSGFPSRRCTGGTPYASQRRCLVQETCTYWKNGSRVHGCVVQLWVEEPTLVPIHARSNRDRRIGLDRANGGMLVR